MLLTYEALPSLAFFFLMPFHSGFGSLQETLLNQALSSGHNGSKHGDILL